MDFQLVLNFPPHEIARILNTLGLRVQDGEQFKNGDLVVGIYEGCDVRLTEFDEDGRTLSSVLFLFGVGCLELNVAAQAA